MQTGTIPADDMQRAEKLLDTFRRAAESALFMKFEILIPYAPEGVEIATTGNKTTGNEHVEFVAKLYADRIVSGEFLKEFFTWKASSLRDGAHAAYDENIGIAYESALHRVDGAFANAHTAITEFYPNTESDAMMGRWIGKCLARTDELSAECVKFGMRMGAYIEHEMNGNTQVRLGDMNFGRSIKAAVSFLPISDRVKQEINGRIDGLDVGSVAAWENASAINETAQMLCAIGIGRLGGPLGMIFEKLYFTEQAAEQIAEKEYLPGALFLAALWNGPLAGTIKGTSALSKVSITGIRIAGVAGAGYLTVGLAQGLAFSAKDVQDFGFSVEGATALVEQGIFAGIAIKGAARGGKKGAKPIRDDLRITNAANKNKPKPAPANPELARTPALAQIPEEPAGKRANTDIELNVETEPVSGKKQQVTENSGAPQVELRELDVGGEFDSIRRTLGADSKATAWCRNFIQINCSNPEAASKVTTALAKIAEAGGTDAIVELQKICEGRSPMDNLDKLVRRISAIAEATGADSQLFLSVLQVASECKKVSWSHLETYVDGLSAIARNTASGEAVGKARDVFMRMMETAETDTDTKDIADREKCLKSLVKLSEEVPGEIVNIMDIALLGTSRGWQIAECIFECELIVRVAGQNVGAELIKRAGAAGEDAQTVLFHIGEVAKMGSADARNRMKLLLELYPPKAGQMLIELLASEYRKGNEHGYQEAINELAKEETVKQLGRIYAGGFGNETPQIAKSVAQVAVRDGSAAAKFAVELAFNPPDGRSSAEILRLFEKTCVRTKNEVSNFRKIVYDSELMGRIDRFAAQTGDSLQCQEERQEELVRLGAMSGSGELVDRAIEAIGKYGEDSSMVSWFLRQQTTTIDYTPDKLETTIDRLNDPQLANEINNTLGRIPIGADLLSVAANAGSLDEAIRIVKIIGRQTGKVANAATEVMLRVNSEEGIARVVEFLESGLIDEKLKNLDLALERNVWADIPSNVASSSYLKFIISTGIVEGILEAVSSGADTQMIEQIGRICCEEKFLNIAGGMYVELTRYGIGSNVPEGIRMLTQIAAFGSMETVEQAATIVLAHIRQDMSLIPRGDSRTRTTLAGSAPSNGCANVFLDSRMIEYMTNRTESDDTLKKTAAIRTDGVISDINAIVGLEISRPGAALELMENPNGIRAFGRYKVATLAELYDNTRGEVQNNKPLMVVVMPRADWNGAFYYDSEFVSQMQKDFNVQIVESGSKIDLAKQLSRITKKYGKISAMMLGGHGTSGSLRLGKGKYGMFEIDSLLESKSDAARYFEKNAPIILISCSTGASGGIAQKSSAKYDLRFYAPDVDGNLKLCKYLGRGKNGAHLFEVEYRSEDTPHIGRAYANGTQVEGAVSGD